MTAIAERVAAGAALLDEKIPGWWKQDAERPILLSLLDTDSCQRCVLGQAFGPGQGDYYCGYDAGLELLGLSTGPAEEEYGFDGGWDEHDDLTAEWKRVIQERRTAP